MTFRLYMVQRISALIMAPLVLMPDRAELYERCDARFARMMENGAVAEVSALLERGLHADLPLSLIHI